MFLNDETFEHDTQAATGATTGDWIVLFCDKSKFSECRQIMAFWNDLSERLFGRSSVAYVPRVEATIGTFMRFGIKEDTQLPLVLFFKRGKYYEYKAKEWDFDKIAEFVADADLKEEGKKVPAEVTFWDEVKVFAGHFKEELIKELKDVSGWESKEGLNWSGIAMVSAAPILMSLFVLIAVCYKDEPANARTAKEIEAEKAAKKKGNKAK